MTPCNNESGSTGSATLVSRSPSTNSREARASFAYWQPGYGPVPQMDFYSLAEGLPGTNHGPRSSVSRRTLERLGYSIPELESAKAEACRPAEEVAL